MWRLPETPPGQYHSALVVRVDDPRDTLAAFDGATIAINGADYSVSFKNNNMLEKQIDEADIVAYDIESSNGVIHVINLVLDEEGFFSQQ